MKNGVDAHTKVAKKTVDMLKKATPRITLFVVKASTEVFNKNEPLSVLGGYCLVGRYETV